MKIQKQELKDAFIGEIDFLSTKGSSRLKDLVKDTPVNGSLEEIYEFFIANGLGKLALRDIKFEVVEGDGEQIPTLTGSYHVVPHPLYQSFNQHEDPKYKEYGKCRCLCCS